MTAEIDKEIITLREKIVEFNTLRSPNQTVETDPLKLVWGCIRDYQGDSYFGRLVNHLDVLIAKYKADAERKSSEEILTEAEIERITKVFNFVMGSDTEKTRTRTKEDYLMRDNHSFVRLPKREHFNQYIDVLKYLTLVAGEKYWTIQVGDVHYHHRPDKSWKSIVEDIVSLSTKAAGYEIKYVFKNTTTNGYLVEMKRSNIDKAVKDKAKIYQWFRLSDDKVTCLDFISTTEHSQGLQRNFKQGSMVPRRTDTTWQDEGVYFSPDFTHWHSYDKISVSECPDYIFTVLAAHAGLDDKQLNPLNKS